MRTPHIFIVAAIILLVFIGLGIFIGIAVKKCPVCPKPDTGNEARLAYIIERMKGDSAVAAFERSNAEATTKQLRKLLKPTDKQVNDAYTASRTTDAARIMRDLCTSPPSIPAEGR